MTALIALPMAAFVLLSALARRVLRRGGLPDDWPAGLVVGGLLLCGFVVVVTEGLSLAGWLSPGPVIAAWALFVVSLSVGVIVWRVDRPEGADNLTPILPSGWREAAGPGFWMWLVTAGLLLFTLVVAVCAPPNQHDALGYHLPRQIMWMQMGRVAHYPTEDLREIQFPPLAEYLQAHTMLLTGGDLWVHLTSWLAYALMVPAAGLACRAIGAPRAAPLAALLAACQPSMFMLSATPKNDVLLAFSVAALAWLAFECLGRRSGGVICSVLIGLALGVGAMTKTSAVLFMFPLCLVIAASFLWQCRAGALWRGAIMAAVATLMVAGHTWRNVDAFGSVFGPMARDEGGFGLSMERHDPAALASNVVRHLSSHIPLRDQGTANEAETMVRAMHTRMGWDVDDPKTSWLASYSLSTNIGTLSQVPAPLHVVLLLATPLVLLARWRWRPEGGHGRLWLLWGCSFAAIAIYVVMVKWQVWQPRLHAPAFALASVPIAVAVWPSRRAPLAWLATAFVGLPAFAFVLWAGIPHSRWPHQGVWAALSHPRHPSLRWHPPRAATIVERQLEALDGIEAEHMAIICWSMQYNVMRQAREHMPGIRFTGLNPNLGRTGRAMSGTWHQPDVFVTEGKPMAFSFGAGGVLRRVGPPGCLNVFLPSDRHPERPAGEAMMGLLTFQAFDDFLADGRLEHTSESYLWNAARGVLLPGSGVDLQLPENRVPRTLLLALNPLDWQQGEVVVLLDDVELARSSLPQNCYTLLEVPYTLRRPGQVLKLRFPGAESRNFAASVGWAQLPTTGHLTWYDQTRAGQPFEPKPQPTADQPTNP